MAESENDNSTTANFWLPSEFLTDDDFLFGVKESPPPKPTKTAAFYTRNISHCCLPSTNNGGFVDFFSTTPTLNSPVESVTSSAEAEEKAERDEFLAELTRQLARTNLGVGVNERPGGQRLHSREKSWGMLATSPQSTLSGFSGWSNRCCGTHAHSVPISGCAKDEAFELLYAAAGEIARMKMNAEVQARAQVRARILSQQQQSRGLLGIPCNGSAPCCHAHSHTHTSFNNIPPATTTLNMKYQSKGGWFHQPEMQQQLNRGNETFMRSVDWPSLRAAQQQQAVQQRNQYICNHSNQFHRGTTMSQPVRSSGGTGMKAVFLGESVVPTAPKRQSTGTGVFLPRRYGSNNNNTSYETPPRKDKGCPTVLLPARVVQALNLNVEDVNQNAFHGYPSLSESYLQANNHDMLMAGRRNGSVLLGQQNRAFRGEGPMATNRYPETLPQDWTY